MNTTQIETDFNEPDATSESAVAINGARDMLRESAKQHRTHGDLAYAASCNAHAASLGYALAHIDNLRTQLTRVTVQLSKLVNRVHGIARFAGRSAGRYKNPEDLGRQLADVLRVAIRESLCAVDESEIEPAIAYLQDGNCASWEVANRRIRGLVRAALESAKEGGEG